jgi:hypothetical protein
LSSFECSETGGEVVGTCAKGFGTCCRFSFKPDSTRKSSIKKKVAYLQNLNFPENDIGLVDQTFSLVPINENICQIRLDFNHFDLNGGLTSKIPCEMERFRIMSSRGNLMPFGDLCGSNSGQHLYLPVDDSEIAATIEITTIRAVLQNQIEEQSLGYLWNLKVTQVKSTNSILF